jgi:hypothetical protein
LYFPPANAFGKTIPIGSMPSPEKALQRYAMAWTIDTTNMEAAYGIVNLLFEWSEPAAESALIEKDKSYARQIVEEVGTQKDHFRLSADELQKFELLRTRTALRDSHSRIRF